jgi:tRNA pseudouridine65 synthase
VIDAAAEHPADSGPQLPLLHLDEGLAAIHKPAGIHTHASALSPGEDSAMRWLRDRLGRRVWPVHRLDRSASGLVLFALDPDRAAQLALAFRERRVHKRYLALCRGWPAIGGRCERPLAENLAGGGRVLREAVTVWRRLQTVERPVPVGPWPSSRYALIELLPETGRAHQLRRHLAGLNHPLLGDTQHGDRAHNRALAGDPGLRQLALVCVGLEFDDPQLGSLRLETSFDPGLDRVARALGFDPAAWATAGGQAEPLLEACLPDRPGRGWRKRAQRRERRRSRRMAGGCDPGDIPGEPCPLCGAAGRGFYAEGAAHWLDCAACGLLWRAAAQRISHGEEALRYDQHTWNPLDEGHRRFLAPLAEAVQAGAPADPAGREALDYGSGPASTLAAMLSEAGWQVTGWDPLYRPAAEPLQRRWPRVLLCEVFEHFHRPAEELDRLDRLLEPGGRLLMSSAPFEPGEASGGGLQAFREWSYRRDPTHAVFLGARSAAWIAARWGWSLKRHGGRVFEFIKPGA